MQCAKRSERESLEYLFQMEKKCRSCRMLPQGYRILPQGLQEAPIGG